MRGSLRKCGSFFGLWLLNLVVLAGSAFGQRPPSPVVVAPVEDRRISPTQSYVGTVMPVKTSVIGSAVDGRVVEFPVNEGDRVKKDQTLAQLLTETIKLEHQAAAAELEQREAELEELENGTRPELIEQAEATMKGRQALRDYHEARHKRMQALYGRGAAVTEEQVEESFSAFVEAQQDYLRASAAHELAVRGPRKEQIARARAAVAAQESQVNRLSDMIAKHRIRSPFDGYVTSEHTEIGAWVSKGDPVAEVVALDQVDVLVHLVEQHLPYLRTGQAVRVEFPAISAALQPEDENPPTVALIVPKADEKTRTFPVKVRIQNESRDDNNPRFQAGMLARVELPTAEARRVLLVPKDAIVLGGRQPTVFVVRGDADSKKQIARPVPVQTGLEHGSLIEVQGELTAKDSVVIEGNERLRPPQQEVRVVKKK